MNSSKNNYIKNFPNEFNNTSEGIFEPYIGPRPFDRTIEDQKRFFGRDYETEEIVSLIVTYRPILIYAQSGAGKTSIFNAQIIPTLKQYGFKDVFITRVNSLNDIPYKIKNLYVYNALQNLEPELDTKLLENISLTEFLQKHYFLQKDTNHNENSVILIFDQFEEIFQIKPPNWQEQIVNFFNQVAKALNDIPSLQIVFLIREDYLTQLDSYRHLLPGNLGIRFRLERLRKDSAIEIIKEVSKRANYDIPVNEIEQIVQDLTKIKVEDKYGKLREEIGEYIEPIHLQLVFQRLWDKRLISKDIKSNSSILSDLTNIDEALEDFYNDAIYAAVSNTNVKEEYLRRWCEENLITSAGTRGLVLRGKESTAGIQNDVIGILIKRYLIQEQVFRGVAFYELVADRLIQPIRLSNLKWKRKHKRKFGFFK